MKSIEIAIYGAGGFARELAWLIDDCNMGADEYRAVCFIDDDPSMHDKELNGIPVLDLMGARRAFPRAACIGGVGSPQVRERIMTKATEAGFEYATIIHPRVERSDLITYGTGNVICAGSILTVNIRFGVHVQVNLDCTIGHDAVLEDYVTLAPGVHVSGYVHIGRRVYIGTGANIINGTKNRPLVIGEDAIIGAGACVVRDVPANMTVAGVPAKPLKKKEE
jgi:sugar O-acyltransferase (sialic acid O-acetyltransferase NeuD family)